MALRKKRRHHGEMSRHIHLLMLEYAGCFLMVLILVGVQFFNVISRQAVSEDPALSILGSIARPFTVTSANCFPFLLIPIVLLAVADLFLRRFFERNGGIGSDRIPFFEKHPHTRSNKRRCKLFVTVSGIASLALSVVTYCAKATWWNYFGTVLVGITLFLLWRAGKLLRRKKRSYLYQKQRVEQVHGKG